MCATERIPGEGEGTTCFDQDELFSKSPIVPYLGSRQAPGDPLRWQEAWVWGFAAKPIARVRLILTDCSTKDLSLDADGVFFDLEGPSTLHASVWPYKLVGLDASGTETASILVRLGAPPTAAARAAGIAAPAVPAPCA